MSSVGRREPPNHEVSWTYLRTNPFDGPFDKLRANGLVRSRDAYPKHH